MHAEGGGGELGVEIVDELGDAGLAAGGRCRSTRSQGLGQVGAVGRGVAGSSDSGDDQVRVERAELAAVFQAGRQRRPGGRVERGGERPPRQVDGSTGGVDSADGDATDLAVRRAV